MVAVHQLGAGPGRLYLRHLFPNTAATLLVSAKLAFREVILAARGLSFLDPGNQPLNTDLGKMVSSGRSRLATAPCIPLAPPVAIVRGETLQ